MMGGIGDAIYERAFVRPDDYVITPWPEIFLDRKCLPAPDLKLKSARKAMATRSTRYARWPAVYVEKSCCYRAADLKRASIIEQMAADCARTPRALDLPDFGPSPVAEKRIALVRPVTLRREWHNAARAPDAEYIAQAARALHEAGFTVVSVADVNGADEWMLDPAPYADVRFEHGELRVTEMLALVQHAACAVGGVGWIVPACMAAQVPLLCVLGGLLNRNAPDRITTGEHRITFAWPDDPCWCDDMQHDCRKTITGFGKTLENWIGTLT